LNEFNKRRFPESLKLNNAYLQHLSGVSSNSSFDAARNILINANIIKHKSGNYALVQPEKVKNELSGYYWIYPSKRTTPKKPSAEQLEKFVSPEVAETWLECKGAALKGAQITDLMLLEKSYGVKGVVQKIREASIASNYEKFPQLTYLFFKMIVNNPKTKGEVKSVRINERNTKRVATPDEDWERTAADRI
jgi:hypothetical protein